MCVCVYPRLRAAGPGAWKITVEYTHYVALGCSSPLHHACVCVYKAHVSVCARMETCASVTFTQCGAGVLLAGE